MKILYGVQGTGNGHLSRARQLGPELIKLGVEIDWVMSGRDSSEYFDMDEFTGYRTFCGLTFQVHRGQIQPIETLRKLKLKQSLSDIRALNTRHYDLVISDYEPITAWAAKTQKTPSLGLAHQYAFLHPSVPKIEHHTIGNALLKHFAPTQTTLGLHWHHFDAPILPPIFGAGADRFCNTPDPTQVLVYLPHDSLDPLLPILHQQTDFEFHVFTKELAPQQLGSVHVHRLSRSHFLETLNHCAHVVCAAGFELVSEALSLGRHILVKPLQKQTEQLANARALKLLGYATVYQTLDAQKLHDWLHEDQSVRVHYPNVAQCIAQSIVKGQWETLATDSMYLWQQCSTPEITPIKPSLHSRHPNQS